MKGGRFEAAHQVLVRWADLESSGKLYKERQIDGQFLSQVFGDALGHAEKTAGHAKWQLEHQFAIPGVGTADGALGHFPASNVPLAVIELKGAGVDLDRDQSNGRTAVQQAWDYRNATPDCQWVIVSNFRTIRLYHRDRGTQVYEEFDLQELRETKRFAEFYYLFEYGGLLPSAVRETSRAAELLAKTRKQQNTVGDKLYEHYHLQRLRLIDHLVRGRKYTLDDAVHIAQRLLDRVIFIAFCEDRGLLPEECLDRAWRDTPAFSRVTNPRWHNFLALFQAVDRGSARPRITAYNGNLFKPDPSIDELDLDDEPWTQGLRSFGEFDFSEEVNVEVLGHLFERSVTELEKLRVGGLFALKQGTPLADEESNTALARMPKSAQRKRFGIYYTPPAFTGLLVERTIDRIVADRFARIASEHNIKLEARKDYSATKRTAFWKSCLNELKLITVCDPACGSGAFLIRAYDALDAHYKTVVHGIAGAGATVEETKSLEDSIPDLILNHNIFGVDLSDEAVEISQLALWIRSAREGKSLADLSRHVVAGNSLVDDPAVDPKALDWAAAFPSVFGRNGPGGFTCVIGNPPWERIKVQDREFFSLTDPETASAVSAADRKKRIAALPKRNPELHERYLEAKDDAQRVLDYARQSRRYPLTGKGDINTYMLFAELAKSIVAPDGLVGLLVPSGIATDKTTKEFFDTLVRDKCLHALYDFENRKKVFPDVDGRFKFSAMIFGGTQRPSETVEFLFFAHAIEEVLSPTKARQIELTAADIALLNPNTKTCPIFRTRRDADLTKSIYKRIPVLIDHNRKRGGNPWGVKFLRMFDQTNDAKHFKPAKHWDKLKYKLDGNIFVKGKRRALPLYEGKMVQAYDHRATNVIVADNNWVRQGQKADTTLVEHQNPEYAVIPRWWVAEGEIDKALDEKPGTHKWFLGFKDISSPTNARTMIAAFVPRCAATNKLPMMLTDRSAREQCTLLANLNALVYDFIMRQKIGGVTLNFFIVEQVPTLPPERYEDPCPWSPGETLEAWINERVLKLTCTSDDMIPLANACEFRGSTGEGIHRWKESERAELQAELDAAFAHLYGLEHEDLEYILTTFPSVHEDTKAGVIRAFQDLAVASMTHR